MPPKKAKKKGKGKDEDELQMKLKKATHQIDSLKDELVFRREVVRRAQSVSAISRSKTIDLEEQMEQLKDTARDNNAELVRQYRAIEDNMNLKVYELQVECDRTKTKLTETEKKLQDKCDELVQLKEEKDEQIAQLERQIWNMERFHLTVLTEAFEKLTTKVRSAHDRWVSESIGIQQEHKDRLLELGLKPFEF